MKDLSDLVKPVVKVVRSNSMVVKVLLALFIICNMGMPSVMNNVVNSNIGIMLVSVFILLVVTNVNDNVIIVLSLMAICEMVCRAKHSWMYGSVQPIQSSMNTRSRSNAISNNEYEIEGFEPNSIVSGGSSLEGMHCNNKHRGVEGFTF